MPIVPFLSKEMLEKLVQRCDLDDLDDLMPIVPFLPQDSLARILKNLL